MDIPKNCKLLMFFTFPILVAACATASTLQATHYWQASEAKSERDYKIDNGNCQDIIGNDESAILQSETPSFAAYRNCMVEKGYVLRTYH